MAINFNELPSTKPVTVLPKGFYMATILKAEMKISKTGNPYLSLQYDLNDGAGKTGKLFDLQMESEKEFLRYKLQRFINALQLNLAGSFEMKDLCKLVTGKKLIVDVTSEDSDRGEQNTINSFEHEIYYPISEWASLKAGTSLDTIIDDAVPAPTDADAPVINAADADDASNTTEEY